MGCRIIPVLVYYPDVTTVLGEAVVRDLKAIKDPVDILASAGTLAALGTCAAEVVVLQWGLGE